jgi:LuxR family maltose regulon positive regulatory protein
VTYITTGAATPSVATTRALAAGATDDEIADVLDMWDFHADRMMRGRAVGVGWFWEVTASRDGREVSMSAPAPAHGRRSVVSASDPILTSKITVPNVPPWAVPRSRITKLIAEGARWCPLTVVTGPPGAGKTMALALWAAAEPGAVAWVGLDDFDNRPGVFWSYVVAALRQAGVAVPKALRAGPAAQEEDGFLLRLTAVLAAQDPPVTLVLDDLHLLADPAALKGLEFVLRNAGPGLRLLVASRMDPLLPLHRYRLAGYLAEVRASDLAFSLHEAALLLDQHGALLTADAVENLTERTEGWAAGLRLAAISLATHPDPDLFVKELMAEDSALTCYLVDEVLDVQPPQVREVLLCASILEHVSGAAAVELTGVDRAAGILADLARSNALVQPIGSGWYRYHTLFAEMLRLRLRYEYPDRVAALHQRAAGWYQRNGMLTSAVRHAVAAGDWSLAVPGTGTPGGLRPRRHLARMRPGLQDGCTTPWRAGYTPAMTACLLLVSPH